jgi:hypothetical protein
MVRDTAVRYWKRREGLGREGTVCRVLYFYSIQYITLMQITVGHSIVISSALQCSIAQ